MRCAIECLKFLQSYYLYDFKAIEEELEKRLCDKGLSILDVVETLNQFHINCKVYKSTFLLKNTPCVLYLKGKKSGHFIVLLKNKGCHVTLYDPYLKKVVVSKWRLYLKWSHISIVCYN